MDDALAQRGRSEALEVAIGEDGALGGCIRCHWGPSPWRSRRRTLPARGYAGATIGICQPMFRLVNPCSMEAGCWRALPPPNARKLLPDVARRFRVRRLQPGSDSALEGALRRRQRDWRIGRSGTAHFGPNPRGFSPAVGAANRLIFVKNQRLKICIFCI